MRGLVGGNGRQSQPDLATQGKGGGFVRGDWWYKWMKSVPFPIIPARPRSRLALA